MREILFRAKKKNWSELPKEEWWVEGYFCYFMDTHCVLPRNLDYDAAMFGEQKVFVIIDPATLCQFTGLKDKDGNRIWENDILHRAYHSKDDCIVVWYDGRFCFKTIHGQYNQDPMTLLSICFAQKTVDRLAVIGSVFDDKNLLGKTDYRREQEKEPED